MKLILTKEERIARRLEPIDWAMSIGLLVGMLVLGNIGLFHFEFFGTVAVVTFLLFTEWRRTVRMRQRAASPATE